jgi:hypothetical protein
VREVTIVRLEAIPQPGSDAAAEYGGAMINVWMVLPPGSDPALRARQEVDSSGWHVVEVEAVTHVERHQLDDESDLALFDQCLVDEIVMVFHVWPLPHGGSPH